MAGMIALRGSTTKLRSVDAAHETSAEAPGCQAVLAATSAVLSIVGMPAACAVGSPDDESAQFQSACEAEQAYFASLGEN